MTPRRTGQSPSPTDAPAPGKDRPSPWSDFHSVLDQMFDLLEGGRQGDGVPAPGSPPRRQAAAAGRRAPEDASA